jgi:hypothetical protein
MGGGGLENRLSLHLSSCGKLEPVVFGSELCFPLANVIADFANILDRLALA